MLAGDCFLAGNEEEEKLHLRIIATPPEPDGCVIVVSVTTRRRTSETLVKLQPGDHPFIRQESTVAYRYAEITWLQNINAAIASGAAKAREPISAELLRRIQDGLLESDFTPNGVRHFAKEVLGR
jgi:hypothetical protein